MSRYIVWLEDSDRENGKLVEANYEREAAQNWAEWYDAWGADYLIMGGQAARVFVTLDKEGSEPMLFEVRGESQPVYFARMAER